MWQIHFVSSPVSVLPVPLMRHYPDYYSSAPGHITRVIQKCGKYSCAQLWTWYWATPCYTMLHHVTSCYTMLHNSEWHWAWVASACILFFWTLDQSIYRAALHHIQLVLTLSIRLHFFPSLPIPFHSITLQDLDRTQCRPPVSSIGWDEVDANGQRTCWQKRKTLVKKNYTF